MPLPSPRIRLREAALPLAIVAGTVLAVLHDLNESRDRVRNEFRTVVHERAAAQAALYADAFAAQAGLGELVAAVEPARVAGELQRVADIASRHGQNLARQLRFLRLDDQGLPLELARWPASSSAAAADDADTAAALRATLATAADSGNPSVSAPLWSADERAWRYLAVVPVRLPADSGQRPVSFTVGTYIFGSVLELARRNLPVASQRVWIFADTADSALPVYEHRGGHRSAPLPLPPTVPSWAEIRQNRWHTAETLVFGDRHLTVVFSEEETAPLITHFSFDTGLLAACGMLLATMSVIANRRRERQLASVHRAASVHTALVSTVRDAYLSTDETGRIVEWSPSAERLFGWSAEQALGRRIDQLILPPDTEGARLAALLDPAGSEAGDGVREIVGIKRCGRSLVLELVVTAARIPEGMRYFAFIRDISERRRDEEHLQRYRQIFDAAPEPLLFIDSERRYGVVNAAHARLLGRPEAELIGQPIRDVLGSAKFATLEPHLEAALAGEPRHFRFSGRFAGGRVHVLDVRYEPFRVNDAIRGVVVSLHDVSELSTLIQALEVSSQRYRNLFDEAPVMYALIAADAGEVRITDCNDNFLTTLRLDRDAVRGRRLGDFIAGPAAGGHALLQRALGGAMSFERQTLLAADGRRIEVLLKGSAETSDDGTPLGVRLTGVDISALQQVRSDLEAAETRFRQLVESLPQLVWTCTPDGCCDYLSSRCAEYTGIPASAQLGSHWIAQVHPDDRWRQMQAWRHASSSGEPIASEIRLRRHDGVYHWFDNRAVAVRDGEGRIVKWIGSCSDIQAQRELIEHLQDSEARWQYALEGNEQGVWDWQLDTDRLSFSPRWREMFGYTEVGLPATAGAFLAGDMVPADEIAEITRVLELHLRGETPVYRYEHRLRHGNGEQRWILDQGKVVERDADDRPLRMIGTHTDITERRAANELRREAQKMEAIGQLTGGLAHDFNNLLGIVIGNLDLLAGSISEERARNRVGVALAAAERGAELVKSLLAVARRQSLKPALADVVALVDNLLPLFRHSVGARIEVVARLHPRPLLAVIDTAGLEGALLNLVINARDAMPGGGRMQVEVRPETPPGGTTPARLLIEIADTGNGMPPEILARATEPFFTTKERGRGTGLGLAMVAGFAQQSEGQFQLASEPGQGTRASIVLPLQANDSGLDPLPPAPPPPGGHEHILVVDDEAHLVELSAAWLRQLGYRVSTTRNAAEALERIGSEHFDLLFSDIVMPGAADGIWLAKRAQGVAPTLAILLTSGFADLSRNRQDEIHWPVLAKPYRLTELARAARAALDRTPHDAT